MATTDSNTASHASNVYLFKNGYGMIVKTFDFPSSKDNNGQPVELFDPPSNPVHGTFWIQSLSNHTTIECIRTRTTQELVERDCLTIEDLIEANVGEDVQILVTDGTSKNSEWISGRIKSVKRTQPSFDQSDTTAGGASTSMTSRSNDRPSSNLLLFEKTGNGLLALSLSNVQSIQGASLKTVYSHRRPKNCLSIDYQNQSDSNDTGLMKYLTFGITWVPSYSLTLLSSTDPSIKKLRVSSKAVILNDIENLIVDKLFCIVGFPNISKYASVIDPTLSGENIKAFLTQLTQSEAAGGGGGGRHHNRGNAMSQSVMSQMAIPMSSANDWDLSNIQQDTDTGDLHLYEFQNVLLEKKERVTLPIFDMEIPYRDFYHCKIDAAVSYHPGTQEKKQFEEVWHSVEFENLSNVVWTTAPIVITKDQNEQQLIGQDTLTYTLKGATTFVNLTTVLDVRVQLEENVTSTDNNRVTHLNYHYVTDHIDGKLLITNYKSEEVQVVLNASIVGKLSDFSVVPKKDKIKVDESIVNQQHDLRWEVTVQPKQRLEITYVKLYHKRAY